jgi:phosphoribosyl-AMP cyclohydrolase / phosphoribosyl-ATP pyrophosphohydrolase
MNLIPTIIQNANTKQVLMLGYSNEESLAKTKATGHVWFYSRSKERLWEKGETSHHYLNVVEFFEDCDQDTLLITAVPTGLTCHTGNTSCFGSTPSDALAKTAQIINQRKISVPEGSYTKILFAAGQDKMLAKIVEESGEVVKAALKESEQRLIEESVDLIFHLQVLLVERDISWSQIQTEFARRQK